MANRVAIVQSSFLPWKGFFEIIHDVDTFVFYDTVQFSKRSWINRNRIKSPLGTRWLTVPVNASTKNTILETMVSDANWHNRIFSTLRQSYYKQEYWWTIEDLFSQIEKENFTSISEINQFFIKEICRLIGIETKLICSSTIPQQGSKSDRLISILRHLGADSYLSGPSAKSYIGREFHELGIELCWKNYDGYPEYIQPHGEFDHFVSIVDILSSMGPNTGDYVYGWRENSNMKSYTIEH